MLHSQLNAMMGRTETHAFFEFVEQCHHMQDLDEVPALLKRTLPVLLNHELAACGIGNPSTGRISYYINQNYPRDYEKSVIDSRNVINSPVFLAWSQSNRPQIFDQKILERTADQVWLDRFWQHDLRNIAAHGLADISGSLTSYFTFSRIPAESTQRSLLLLDLLIPHMHIAFTRAVARRKRLELEQLGNKLTLSDREIEILKWVHVGRSNQQIADRLKISVNTVRNHLYSIGVKLSTRNRAHAVAKALELGLISW